ncbi:hypothetical protein [Oceaniglobus trochenteri]|uniref:hypothetical protein n=1 Tax=Oceaniglobus trochenteri TaxID=2763260 RepID=UPI001CFFAA2B|nr:hypothetical protein [Oceaniglobus trochenteri]
MRDALARRNSTVNPTSCFATMEILSEAICQGRPMTGQTFNGADRPFVPKKAIDTMTRLVAGDAAIFVSVAPDHHFTVLPLSDREIAIMQGFQGCYGIDEWINESGKIPMLTKVFLDCFDKLFSPDAGVRVPAAIVLFATPGSVEDVAAYFGVQASFVKSMSTASPNLFQADGKASLAA